MKKLWKNKELRNFLAAFGVCVFLTGMFAWENGWLPSLFPTNTAAPAAITTAVTTSQQDKEDQEFLQQCYAQSAAMGVMPFCETPRELQANHEYFVNVTWPWAKRHWFQELTAVAMFASFITAIVMFCFWRSARRKAKRAKMPVVIGADGQEITPPTLRSKHATLILPGDPRIKGLTWDQIIGQDVAKEEILEVLEFMQHPERFEDARLPRGVLMYGAHGTGKTLIARTLASIANVPVLEVAGPEFVHMFVGVGAAAVRDLYADADAVAEKYGWCIVFIDEAETVAGRRGLNSSGGGQEHDQTTNQFLKELDGIIPRPRVVTICATNRRDMMDPAALRPKRLDRQIEFFNPNIDDRELLLALYIPERLRHPELNLRVAARGIPGASGAHLENMANEAKILRARRKAKLITQEILDEAVLKVIWGSRRDKDRKLWTPQEVKTVRVHESGHALAGILASGRLPLRFTMVPRGGSGGHVMWDDAFTLLSTEEHLKHRLIMMMGGWAATKLLCDGQHDTGIAQDFEDATKLAVEMVTRYGMSTLGFASFKSLSDAGLLSDELKRDATNAVNVLLEQAKAECYRLLSENLDLLRELEKAVDEKETLFPADLKKLLKGKVHLVEAESDSDATPPAPHKLTVAPAGKMPHWVRELGGFLWTPRRRAPKPASRAGV